MLAAANELLATAGLSITHEDALMLAERRAESLAALERVEFGTPAVINVIDAIATSPHLAQGNVAGTIAELQDAFYAIRNDLPVDVPDSEILEALRGCFDKWGDATEVSSMSTADIMAFSGEYVQATEAAIADKYRIVDEEGREYSLDPAEWDYDEQADGWDGERWSDDWND